MNAETLPRWDLAPIYPSLDSPEFTGDLDQLAAWIDALVTAIPAESLRRSIDRINEIRVLLDTAVSYAAALLTTDTANPVYLAAVGRTEKLGVAFANAMTAFAISCASRRDEFDAPELADYRFFLTRTADSADHLMSREEESLASEMLLVSGKQWARLQEALNSSISADGVTLTELRCRAGLDDRHARREALRRELALLKEHEVAFCYALNGAKGTGLTLGRRRGWESPLEQSCRLTRITSKALSALIGAIEKSLPLFRRHMGIKARLLGLEKLDWHDVAAPVGSSARRYTFEETRRIVVRAYSGFSPEMGAFAAKAFDRRWIDAEPRRGKIGGAYCKTFYKARESRILANFDGTFDSVLTLAHELGHAYHGSIVLQGPPLLSDYPTTLAETASLFGETITFHELVRDLSREEALPVIEGMLSAANQSCVDILSRYYFETAYFEKRKEGELTPRLLCDLMTEAQDRSYGEAVATRHPYMWAVKSHYYLEGLDFYNYPYAFGQLLALGLYKRSVGDRAFPSLYKKFLIGTGRMEARDVARLAGCDIEDESFWLESIGVLAPWVDKLGSYAK